MGASAIAMGEILSTWIFYTAPDESGLRASRNDKLERFHLGECHGDATDRSDRGGDDGQRHRARICPQWLFRSFVRCGAAVSGAWAGDHHEESRPRGREEQDYSRRQGVRVEEDRAGD